MPIWVETRYNREHHKRRHNNLEKGSHNSCGDQKTSNANESNLFHFIRNIKKGPLSSSYFTIPKNNILLKLRAYGYRSTLKSNLACRKVLSMLCGHVIVIGNKKEVTD